MKIVNKKLSLEEFKDYIRNLDFSPNNPNKLVIHHTWKPDVDDWKGQKSIDGLKKFYEDKGWSAAPHLFIAEDGIWLFTPMNERGIHAGELNERSIGIEVVGDYDHKVWAGETKINAIGAINALIGRLGLSDGDIHFHREVSEKSCPGRMINKNWLFSELRRENKTISQWAEEAVDFVKKNSLLKVENPQAPLTEERAAVLTYRTIKLLIEQLNKLIK